jgi:hypothetical protein
MAITATDIHFRASTTAGAAGNSTAPGAAGTSLGKYITNADMTDATLNNLFDDITGDQNAANQVDYQCMFVYNAHATLAWQNPVMWQTAEVAGGAVISFGWDTTASSAVGNASAQAVTIANKTTAPAGAAFAQPTLKSSAASTPGNIAATNVKGIWLKRTISAGPVAAIDNDGMTLRVEGDTAA